MASLARMALGAAPSPLDQAAATINVALDDGRFDVAVEIFRRFSPLERIAIGMKAIALGADPTRVQDAAEAAATDLPQDDVEIEMEPDFIGRRPSFVAQTRQWITADSFARALSIPGPRPSNGAFLAGLALLGLALYFWRRK